MSLFRYRLFQIFVILAFAVIFARLFDLQIIQGHKLSKAAKKFHSKAKEAIFRGEIVDRFNKVLALDISKYTLEYNPSNKEPDRELLATEVANLLGLKKAPKLKGSSLTIGRNLTKKQADAIKKLGSHSLRLSKTMQRLYPQNVLASHVLGYVDLYGKARKGIEAKYEEFLTKNPNKKIELSIDSRLQAFTEKALAKRIKRTKAKRGTVLVMDSETGELVTWAVQPSYNPNKYFQEPIAHIKNWTAIDVYQPGSIFKIVTTAAAIESETISTEYKFVDKGFIKVDKWKISNHDYNSNKYQSVELNLKGLFARSSNPFAAHIALKMGAETFYKFIKAFGIGSKTGIELIGESNGILKDYTKWRKSDIASTGIGQGAISVTPLQLLSAVNVVANKGIWVRPTLLKTNTKATGKRVISETTAQTIASLLKQSIAYNLKEKNSRAGKVDGVQVAGKTGTAQKAKPGGGYFRHKTIASFLGFFEINKHKFIILTIVDDPETDGRWGDTVAGPLFNKIATYIKDLYSV